MKAKYNSTTHISLLSDCSLFHLFQLSSWSLKWNLYLYTCVCYSDYTLIVPAQSYEIDNIPIQVLDSHRHLGIVMSADMMWRTHLNQITACAYKILDRIHLFFTSTLCPTAKKSGSQIWRPHFIIKDIMDLDRIQRCATMYILNDFHSNYKNRLQCLKSLPLMMQLELYDILFFTCCLSLMKTIPSLSSHM